MTRFIAKIRTPVRVAQPGRGPMAGFFSLCVQSPRHPGPETLVELLNSDVIVIPFRRAGDGGISLLTRLNIDAVHADADMDPALVAPPTFCFTREERVALVFLDGAEIDGCLRMELPHESNRASDFLNGPGEFCAVAVHDGTLLVNKARIREIRLFQASPRPPETSIPSIRPEGQGASGD